MDLTYGLTQPNPDKKSPDPTQPKSKKVDPCPALLELEKSRLDNISTIQAQSSPAQSSDLSPTRKFLNRIHL